MNSEAVLTVILESDCPQPIPAGKATAHFVYGTCRRAGRSIRRLDVMVDGLPQPVVAHEMPRPATSAPRGGFWTVVSIPAQPRAGLVQLDLRAHLSGGLTEIVPLYPIEVQQVRSAPEPTRELERAAIAVCMATFDPDRRLFQRQIASLRAQLDENWICFVSDDCSSSERFSVIEAEIGEDDRFIISRSERRLGFYRNFERALRMVPAEIDLVALCDQDDHWYPKKLATLRQGIRDAQMVFSDARLVDTEGQVLAESIWEGRRTAHDSLTSLLLSNTVTGAACMFTRRVLDRALPFPEAPGWAFHDHWLGTVALASGDITYLDRPLYDYVQHPDAVLRGLTGKPEDASVAPRQGAVSRRPPYDTLVRWRTRYFHGYIPVRVWAQILISRCSVGMSRSKRRALRRLIAADASVISLTLLQLRRLRRLWGRRETLGAESVIATGILWRRLMLMCAKSKRLPAGICDATIPHFDPQALQPRGWRRRQNQRATGPSSDS